MRRLIVSILMLQLVALSTNSSTQTDQQTQQAPQFCAIESIDQAGVKIGDLLKTSGDSQIDGSVVKASIAYTPISADFGVDVNIFFFDDKDAPNCYFAKSVPGNSNTDGVVLFGKNFMQKLKSEAVQVDDSNTRGLALITLAAAIAAHEYAHALQNKKNCPLRGKLAELHADYLAGWYIRAMIDKDPPVHIPGMTENLKLAITAKRLKLDLAAFEKFTNMGTSNSNSPNFHGTPDERLLAIMSGFIEGRKLNVTEAYTKGLSTIQGL